MFLYLYVNVAQLVEHTSRMPDGWVETPPHFLQKNTLNYLYRIVLLSLSECLSVHVMYMYNVCIHV